MNNEKEILKDILIDESDVIQNLAEIVKKVKTIFVLEKQSGKIIFKNFSDLTNPQKIMCVLMGKYFATRLSIIEDHSCTISEISNDLNIPKTTLSSPLKSLRKSGEILYTNSRYRINPHRIEEVVNLLVNPKNLLKPSRKKIKKNR